MPNQTPNLNLTKPLQTEYYNIDVHNANSDIIDTAFGSINTDKSDKLTQGNGIILTRDTVAKTVNVAVDPLLPSPRLINKLTINDVEFDGSVPKTITGLATDIKLNDELSKKQNTIKTSVVSDTQSSGIEGGIFTAGAWRTRVLNTIDYDGVGITLSNNQITLPAGIYVVNAICPGYCVENHKARLQNITDNQTLILGTSARSASANSTQTQSFVFGVINLQTTKTIELQHYAQTSSSTKGFGNATVIAGVNEIYAKIEITKM